MRLSTFKNNLKAQNIALIFCLLLLSCNENHYQSFPDYNKYMQSSLRAKSWLPNIIDKDCFDIKEIHNLDNNHSYGTFSFSDHNRINKALLDTTEFKEIHKHEVESVLSKINVPKKPSWFLKDLNSNYLEFYKDDLFIIIKDPHNKRIYFTINVKELL